MLPDRVSNPGPLTYESGVLPIALRGPGADMISNTGIALHSQEEEFTFTESLQPSKCKPEYWQNLESSKARTKTQEALSREIIGTIIENCSEKTAIYPLMDLVWETLDHVGEGHVFIFQDIQNLYF